MTVSQYVPWLELVRPSQSGRLSVVTAPTTLIATVAELQNQARVMFPGETDPFAGGEDDLLTMYIEAATQELDVASGWLGRSLITRTLRLSLDRAPPRIVKLPGPPVQSITQIVYTDPDGADQTIASGDLAAAGYKWDLDDTGKSALIWNDDPGWPATEDRPASIRIDYVAGYGDDAADVPAMVRKWILSTAAEMYRDREGTVVGTIVSTLQHVERALDNLRVRV